MKKTFQILSCLLILLFITACSKQQDYTAPVWNKQWETPIKTTDIEKAIEGEYTCVYEYHTVLSGLFSKRGVQSNGYHNSCKIIEFVKLSKGKIKTIVKDEDRKIIGSQLLLDKKDYFIKNNSLVFVEKNGFSMHFLTGYEYHGSTLHLNKSKDIIVKIESQGTGVSFLIIPTHVSNESWAKFKRLK